jgi:putative ABC transport system substrate-binding protein
MRRRHVLVLAATVGAVVALAGGRPGRAQPAKIPTIGVLALGQPDPEFFLRTFREGLRAHGYTEDRNIALDIRSANGKASLLPALAAELVHRNVDIIVAQQTPAAFAAKNATRDIPIVITAGDPVATGLIASLARPGGNITGVSSTSSEMAGKNLEIIRAVLPQVQRIAVLTNSSDPFAKPFLEQIEAAAGTMRLSIAAFPTRPSDDLGPLFRQIVRDDIRAVIIQPTLLSPSAVEHMRAHRLVATSPNRNFTESGGLMSYSNEVAEGYRECATYVDKILKGAKPADLPVQQPTKFALAINLKLARAIGLEIPATLLARADEVID